MKFEDIENIWSVDLAMVSNADRGRIYLARVKTVVEKILSDPLKVPQAIDGKRIRRGYLLGVVGCKPAALSQNPHIKRFLRDADERFAKGSSVVVGKPRIRARLRTLEEGIVELRCLINEQQAEIAVLKATLKEALSVHLTSESGRLSHSRSRYGLEKAGT